MPSDAHDKPRDSAPSRVVIVALRPEIEGGRYPAKRVVGETVEIEADVVADGHDVLRALLVHRAPGATAWQEVEMLAVGNDVWRASFVATALGMHQFTVTAWVDAFASWRHGLDRKVQAGNDVSVELLEGALLVDAAAARARALGANAAVSEGTFAAFAGVLRGSQPVAERVKTALGGGLSDAMARVPDRSHAVHYRHELAVHLERPLAAASS